MAFPIGNWIPSVEKLTRWAEGVKSASITLLAAGAASITGVGVVTAITSDSVSLDPIKVPAPFEERGFTSEIATTRLLDEVTTFQHLSTSAKDRVSIKGKNSADELDKLEAPVGGVDIKRIQGVIQDVLGVKKERITGEITFKKDGDNPIYSVRMRRIPGNQVLLNITARGEPDAVLKQTALAMLEVFDPHIAASIHWRGGDEDAAMRLIDVAIANSSESDHKYSLNLRAYIHVARKRLDAAQADFERIMRLDPQFAPAFGMASWLYREKGQYEKALAEANREIELVPAKWWGYFHRAETLRVMQRFDEAAASFDKALSLKPDDPAVYFQAGQLMVTRDKPAEAGDIYRRGLVQFPESPRLHADYGDLLRKTGQPERALKEFTKALEINPKGSRINRFTFLSAQELSAQERECSSTLAESCVGEG